MELKHLAQEKLKGSEPDVFGLLDDLFAFCAKNGFIAAREEENAAIVFQMSNGSSLPVAVERAETMLRFMCARLCKISNDLNPSLGNIYRGFSTMPYARGSIRIECENTPASHYFRLTYEEANEAAALDGEIASQPYAESSRPSASDPRCY